MKTTNYAGINHAGKNSTVNKNNESGIRYGVISQNAVLQAWADSSEPEYANCCPYCGDEPKSGKDIRNMKRCPSCRKVLKDGDFDYSEPICFNVDDGEYKASCREDGDIFIVLSPYYTYAQFCSPCAPGACHLNNPLESPVEDNQCYCFGKDWFEDEKAPYPVYSVETNELIQ